MIESGGKRAGPAEARSARAHPPGRRLWLGYGLVGAVLAAVTMVATYQAFALCGGIVISLRPGAACRTATTVALPAFFAAIPLGGDDPALRAVLVGGLLGFGFLAGGAVGSLRSAGWRLGLGIATVAYVAVLALAAGWAWLDVQVAGP